MEEIARILEVKESGSKENMAEKILPKYEELLQEVKDPDEATREEAREKLRSVNSILWEIVDKEILRSRKAIDAELQRKFREIDKPGKRHEISPFSFDDARKFSTKPHKII